MGKIDKTSAFFLTLIIAISCLILIANPATAQSIPKPSVPEFTLKLVSHPYDVAPSTSIDPYTGKNVTISHGYHSENKSIEIKITNQAFTPYWLDNSQQQWIMLFYNVSYKGHYGTDWNYYAYNQSSEFFFSQSTSEYTIIPFSKIPMEGELDFRVQAQIGYYDYYYMPYKAFYGQTSGWSSTQTLTIPASPSDLIVTYALIAVSILVIFVVSLLLYRRHQKLSNNHIK